MRAVLVAALVLLAAPAGAAAAPELVQLGEFSEPAVLAAAPSDGSRLFVVERGGIVRLLKHGARAPAPFADLRSKVLAGGRAPAARDGVRAGLRCLRPRLRLPDGKVARRPAADPRVAPLI